MKKVKKYLDKNLFCTEKSICELKSNGHYGVQGSWVYPKNYDEIYDKYSILIRQGEPNLKSPDHICVYINNETIIVGDISVNGIWSKYHYLQTYEHIPRGEADVNGYYQRSTEKEIIKYLDICLKLIKENEKRI